MGQLGQRKILKKMINLKPIPNNLSIDVMNTIWGTFWKKYRSYSNASSAKDMHFTDELWQTILNDADSIYDQYPYEFTINLLGVYIKELHARDLGGYPEKKVNES